MRKRILTIALATVMLVGSTMCVNAAPKSMADGGVFDAEYYAANNPDVVAVFGTDENMLYQHYVLYGKQEGRLATEPGATVITNVAPAPQETPSAADDGSIPDGQYGTQADGSFKHSDGSVTHVGDVIGEAGGQKMIYGGDLGF